MKKSITILFFTLLSMVCYSQQLTYKSGGCVYNAANQKVAPVEVRNLLANNAEALSLYNAGRNKKTWGNVLFYGGLGLVATNLVIGMNTDNTTVSYSGNGYYPSAKSERTNMTAAAIGGALIIASIPIKIGYPKKIKAALNSYNSGVADNNKTGTETTLVAGISQIGLKITF
jgi:hypothetical protein